MPHRHAIALSILLLCSIVLNAQNADTSKPIAINNIKGYHSISKSAEKVSDKIESKLDNTLRRYKKRELRLARRLARRDSLQASIYLQNIEAKYKQLELRLSSPAMLTEYLPVLDTTITSLKFLQQSNGMIRDNKLARNVQHALDKSQLLETSVQKAEVVKLFIGERKESVRQLLMKFPFAGAFKRFSKDAYYFNETLASYKTLIKDRKKAERKTLEMITASPAYRSFLRKHGYLSRFFPNPDIGTQIAGTSPSSAAAMLQTRVQVNNFIQQATGAEPIALTARVTQTVSDGIGAVNDLRQKLQEVGNSSDLEIPDFKPNSQKIKSFGKRLEYTANLQSSKSSQFFPVTTDLGVSVGYKLNDRSVVGLGGSYKLGLGHGWKDISLSNEGIGLRSFIDWKIKGGIWLSGGYEQNYRTSFSGLQALYGLDEWRQSGLIGLSKVVSLKSGVLKKTKMQLLWDFLSYRQVPRTQAILFRVGYTF